MQVKDTGSNEAPGKSARPRSGMDGHESPGREGHERLETPEGIVSHVRPASPRKACERLSQCKSRKPGKVDRLDKWDQLEGLNELEKLDK